MAPRRRKPKKYSDEDLQLAVEAVKDGMSYRRAEAEFGVPRATIKDHVSEVHVGQVGHPTELSQEEEIMIKDMIKLLSEWGFPFSGVDLCHFVKLYLDKKGVSVSRFKGRYSLTRLEKYLQ